MAIAIQKKKDHSCHFEALFEEAAIGIVITNEKGDITAINPFALIDFGYSEDELLGKKIETVIPVRFRKKHDNYREDYLHETKGRTIGAGKCLFALRKDGTEFPVEVNLSKYYNERENYVIAFVRDISDRKKIESEIVKLKDDLEALVEQRTRDLKAAMHQLEISKEALEDALSYQKAILENAGAIIIATDNKGIITLFNPVASKNLGYDESEIINKKTPLIFHDSMETEKRRADLYKELGVSIREDFDVLVEKAKRNLPDEEQYTYIRKDGSTFPVLLTITAIWNHAWEITGFMGIAIDISDRIKTEKKLQESLKKEIELNELKSRFVSMASHEFRTPLSTVLSSSYLLEKYTTTEDQPKRERHIQRIISSINMLTDTLNDFLSLGKIEEGRIHIRYSEFNICEMVTETIEELKSTLKKGQHISYRHTGDQVGSLDVFLLKHIIMNLVSNASKFSGESDLIEIKTSQANNKITFAINDHGIGISVRDQMHLMERFFRGANAANIEGTGLGLHIVSKYAELMNGTVECKSELEKGTEFIITFNPKQKTV
jgi:PAS domain S-box-containing protein